MSRPCSNGGNGEQISIERYKKEYKALNVEFDEYVGKRKVSREAQLGTVLKVNGHGLGGGFGECNEDT